MFSEMEDWLVEVGDEIIRKKASVGVDALSTTEVAIYALWIVDYSVRNSGTLIPMTELHPATLQQLGSFAVKNDLHALKLLALGTLDDELFCDKYYQWFEAATEELRLLHIK